MNSYEYLLKTADESPLSGAPVPPAPAPGGLPAPLRRDPDYDDVVAWNTPAGHTVRHLYDPKRLAEHGGDLKAQIDALNSVTDATGRSQAQGMRTTRRILNTALGGVTGAGLGLLGTAALGRTTPVPTLLGGLAGALYGGTRKVPLPKVQVRADFIDPYDFAVQGRSPVPALYGISARDHAAARHQARVRSELERLREMREEEEDRRRFLEDDIWR